MRFPLFFCQLVGKLPPLEIWGVVNRTASAADPNQVAGKLLTRPQAGCVMHRSPSGKFSLPQGR